MKVELETTGDLHPYYVLDVFTDTPLEGNQLGVFPDGSRSPASRCSGSPAS